VLDALAIDITLREGDLVAGAVVLTKIIDASGQVRLGVCWPDGMSWIERLGMLHAAVAVDTPGASDSAAN
jgi:hypothetical protein